jgi:hypothetical protein
MRVVFKRTGARRYAVLVEVPGYGVQQVHPAPGYDDDIPHDLVHYVVEAELRLARGVFGRAARGGGSFVATVTADDAPRARARAQRKQRRREAALRVRDEAGRGEMSGSERLAAICGVAFRRQVGQRPAPLRSAPPEAETPEERACVARVVARLRELAPRWRALPVEGELAFVWPSVIPVTPDDSGQA